MSKDVFGIALVGCGVVGGGTARILKENLDTINRRTGLHLALKAVVDLKFDHARTLGLSESLFKTSLDEALADPEVKLVIELAGGTGFAKSVFEKALNSGRHVVTANKALLAAHGDELFALARKKGLSIGFEASCAGGIPIIRVLTENLLANRIDALYGIVNGTCNFLLTEMTQKGLPYAEVLKKAQELGYAEADPYLDVSGKDSAHKITILASLAFEAWIDVESVQTVGVDTVGAQDIKAAADWGMNIKLIARAERTEKGLGAWVAPTVVDADHALGRIWGSFNALSVWADSLGHSLYYGRGAGASPTASAVVSDIIAIASGTLPTVQKNYHFWPDQVPQLRSFDVRDFAQPFFLVTGSAQAAALNKAGLGIQKTAPAAGETGVLTQPLTAKALDKILETAGVPRDQVRILPYLGTREEFPQA